MKRGDIVQRYYNARYTEVANEMKDLKLYKDLEMVTNNVVSSMESIASRTGYLLFELRKCEKNSEDYVQKKVDNLMVLDTELFYLSQNLGKMDKLMCCGIRKDTLDKIYEDAIQVDSFTSNLEKSLKEVLKSDTAFLEFAIGQGIVSKEKIEKIVEAMDDITKEIVPSRDSIDTRGVLTSHWCNMMVPITGIVNSYNQVVDDFISCKMEKLDFSIYDEMKKILEKEREDLYISESHNKILTYNEEKELRHNLENIYREYTPMVLSQAARGLYKIGSIDEILGQIPDKLKDDDAFISRLIDINPRAIDFASEELQNDPILQSKAQKEVNRRLEKEEKNNETTNFLDI